LIKSKSVYQLIYAVVLQIPFGQVATYGQIAKIVGGCTPRMVGYAMAALHRGDDVPWQRVINHKGRISDRKSGPGDIIQRKILEMEGIEFDDNGGIDLKKFRWKRPIGIEDD
jgi:methylated-DNA-protein-cysteine methyltransferase related protein